VTELEETVHGPVRAVADWLRANGIDPMDVPVHSRISIEPGASEGDRRIRYAELLRNELGHLRHDPATGRAAAEERTTALKVEPPENVRVHGGREERGADRVQRTLPPTGLRRSAGDHADASAA